MALNAKEESLHAPPQFNLKTHAFLDLGDSGFDFRDKVGCYSTAQTQAHDKAPDPLFEDLGPISTTLKLASGSVITCQHDLMVVSQQAPNTGSPVPDNEELTIIRALLAALEGA